MNQNVDLEKILTVATGPAVDLIFKRVSNFESGVSESPSSEIVLGKWKSLSAESASKVVSVIKDPALLDSILEREKRKTVRRAIARNLHLSRVSRLFLLQSGLATLDYDLIRDALNGFHPEELLEIISADESLSMSCNFATLADSLFVDHTEANLEDYILKLDNRSLSTLVSKAFSKDFSFGLKLLKISKIETFDYSSYLRYNFEALDHLIAEQLIGFLSKKGKEHFLSDCWERKPSLFKDLRDEYKLPFLSNLSEMNSEALMLLSNAAMLSEVLVKNRPIFNNISDELASHLFSTELSCEAKAFIALSLPDKTPLFLENGTVEEIFQAGLILDANLLIKWLEARAQHLTLDLVVKGIEFLPPRQVTQRFLSKMAGSHNLEIEDLLLLLDISFIAKFDTLPRLENYEKVLGKLESLPGVKLPQLYEQVLERCNMDSNFAFIVAEKLVHAEPERLSSWLSSLTDSFETREFVSKHKNVLLPIIESSIRLVNKDWVSVFAEDLTLCSGLSRINSPVVLKSVFDYLNTTWEQNTKYWEAGIGLLPSWSGSVAELAKAAKTI